MKNLLRRTRAWFRWFPDETCQRISRVGRMPRQGHPIWNPNGTERTVSQIQDRVDERVPSYEPVVRMIHEEVSDESPT